jgi:hypothetical protein
MLLCICQAKACKADEKSDKNAAHCVQNLQSPSPYLKAASRESSLSNFCTPSYISCPPHSWKGR